MVSPIWDIFLKCLDGTQNKWKPSVKVANLQTHIWGWDPRHIKECHTTLAMILRISVEIEQNGHTLHSKGSQLTALHVTNCTLMQSEGNEASIFITPICSSGNGIRKIRNSLQFNRHVISQIRNMTQFIVIPIVSLWSGSGQILFTMFEQQCWALNAWATLTL